MKFILTWITLLYLVGCSSSQLTIKNEKILEKEKIEKKIIFTAKEYRKLSEKEKDTGELSISDNDLELLDKPFIQDGEYVIKPVKLSENIHNIANILKDSNFNKEYYVDNLTRFVYKNDKALAIYESNNLHGDDKESGSGYCVGGSQYLFYLKDNEVKIKSLGNYAGEVAPIDPLIN